MRSHNPNNEIPAREYVMPTRADTTESINVLLHIATPVINAGVAPWVIKTANYTAVTGDRIIADTTGGVFTITLPASPSVNDSVELSNPNDIWGTNNLTIGRNGQLIDGVSSDMTADISDPDHRLILFIFIGSTTGWGVF